MVVCRSRPSSRPLRRCRASSGRRTATLRAADLAGAPRTCQLPTLTAPRGGKVVLRLGASEANFPVSQTTARSIVAVHVVVNVLRAARNLAGPAPSGATHVAVRAGEPA